MKEKTLVYNWRLTIVKAINMREFNFPGARTKQMMYYIEEQMMYYIEEQMMYYIEEQMMYYIEEILNEENLDRIIINVGTNNLSYQNQTENEIMMEIIEIVKSL